MAFLPQPETPSAALSRVDTQLLRKAAIGGLLGGIALFLLMGSYDESQGMGFWSIVNACFAAFVYKDAGMTAMTPEHTMPGHMPGHEVMTMTTGGPIVASHLVVGGVLHFAMSAFAAIAFALVIALLLRSGIKPLVAALSSPPGYLGAMALGGALLYVIMMYGIAPALNTEISDFTPRGPFFAAHVLYGAVTGGFVYWRAVHPHGAAWLHAPSGSVAG